MEKEPKAPETPAADAPKVSDSESFIDKRRQEVEKQVITENETIPEPEKVPEVITPKPEEKKEEPKVAIEDPLERIKKSVQKRIDKVVAQKKSVEEELADAKAELGRLKSKPSEPPLTADDKPPTPEQVEAYIIRMREEGNTKEEVSATRYLIKLEKESAVKDFREAQEKETREAKARSDKQLTDWTALQKDYIVYDESGKPDPKNDLTLSNQSGLLYQTALALYQDIELHRDHYSDPDQILGFRRAVADAYREIHQQGLIKTPKGEPVLDLSRPLRQILAEPEASAAEESVPSQSDSLSDAEKVREEIKARKKNRFLRRPSNNQ